MMIVYSCLTPDTLGMHHNMCMNSCMHIAPVLWIHVRIVMYFT